MPPQLKQCHDFNEHVYNCHKKYGKLGEDCVREELEQKRCIAEHLCAVEARNFYYEKVVPLTNNPRPSWYNMIAKNNIVNTSNQPIITNSKKVSCSTIVELFAKPENELIIPEGITKEDRDFCRKVTHKLASCLSRRK